MTDIDEMLHHDGAHFRANVPPPPDLTVMFASVEHRPIARRPRRALTAAALASAAVLVAVLLAFGLTSTRPRSDNAPGVPAPTPAPSVTVNGVVLPFAGDVPWASAVADPTDPRVLTVDADGDQLTSLCGLPTERLLVSSDADTVVVSIAGYGEPFVGSCASVGHGLQRIKVSLDEPLGERHLLDANGDIHRVLNPDDLPTLQVPAGYEPNEPTWDEKEPDRLSRSWNGPSVSSNIRQPGITLTVSPTATANDHEAPDGPVTSTGVPVGTSKATVWHSVDNYNDDTTMRWTITGDRTVELRVGTAAGAPTLSIDDVISLARTVRVK